MPELTESGRRSLTFARLHWKPIATWGFAGLAVAVFLVWAIVWAPGVLARPAPSVADLQSMTASERTATQVAYAGARNAVRNTLVQAIGGAALLTTAFFAWRQIAVVRLGQTTDRFAKSVDNLGAESSAVRLGGVYTLEQVSADDRFSRSVAHVLLAFVYEVTRGAREDSAVLADDLDRGSEAASSDRSRRHATTTPAQRTVGHEVQQALTILVSDGLWKRVASKPINLATLSLRGIDLPRADLHGAALLRADLALADLRGVDLSSADLREVDARGALLHEAHLSNADLGAANLYKARLEGATGSDVHFAGADLTSAELGGATFGDCDFSGALCCSLKAEGAVLTDSIFQGALLKEANFCKADLRGVDFRNADLRLANLTGAHLGANRWDGAQILGAEGLPDPCEARLSTYRVTAVRPRGSLSLRRALRVLAIAVLQSGSFVLVHVATSLADCEARHRKGLYAKARRGEIPTHTGISDPYETPTDAEVTVETAGRSVDECARQVLEHVLHVR
ncbi:pentapeptide repeat-containing protein [Blastococcus brunescens]|uniref:Pentapeptide repeat-containing protein n=1 Tax=Blastococcus brunescens TaxID=1564165 RepID=A0ABZ1B0H6_9ACTN|nr:pentapeptide repeat-containing protein [Blastococcus sp. BMG 8361]WRL64312.1 pentapeptide repeat-containing protein [Blastococcus sp. BMG 8361]